MKSVFVSAMMIAAGSASAGSVTINFEDQFPNFFDRPAVLDDELSGAPYYIEFNGVDLVGFGDVEAEALILEGNEIVMSAVDGFSFNNFAFEIEVRPFFVPQVITVEVTTLDGTTSEFGQYVGDGFGGDTSNFFPDLSSYSDVTSVRLFDTGRLFRVDNLSYDVSEISGPPIPLPTPALLAGFGILGIIGVRRAR